MQSRAGWTISGRMPYERFPLLRRVCQMATWALAIYGLTVLVVFYCPLSDFMVRSLWVDPDRSRAPAIVVLTAWASPDGILNEQALRRIHTAARLFRDGLSPLLIISGGDTESEQWSVAGHMAEFANELGVPRSAIVLENESKNTYESAVRVAALSRKLGFDRALLVTDAAHMRRAAGAFRRQGLSVSPVPADPWALGWETPMLRMRKFWSAIHEYGGLLYYRYRGWI